MINNLKYYILSFTIMSLSCSFSKKNENMIGNHNDIMVKDSISPYGDIIKIYGRDSILGYSSDGTLEYIKYLDSNSLYTLKLYNADKSLKRIEYNIEHPKFAILTENFYPSINRVHSRESWVDSILVLEKDSFLLNILKEEFYENEVLKYQGYYGVILGQNAPIGIHKYFNKLDKLTRTENYIYPTKKRPYIIISEYYDNGNPKWEQIYINHVIHESDREEPTGTWKYYDEDGKLIKTRINESL